MRYSISRLIELALHLDCLQSEWEHLDQLKRRERGGWRHPSLAGPTEALEKKLLGSYHVLFKDLIASLGGQADDISSGRLLQKKRVSVSPEEIRETQDEYRLTDETVNQPVDKTRLAALLAILALWKQKHSVIALAAATPLFQQGRSKALAEAKVPDHHPVDTTTLVAAAVLAKFSADLNNLQNGLASGTVRSYGISWTVQNSLTVGEAAVYLDRLKVAEEYRVGMFSEAILWAAWMSGYREGAVEALKARLHQLGYENLAQVPDEQKQQLPRYEWVGPNDKNTCNPCSSQFGSPVYAASLEDLPDPAEICDGGISCRHQWQLVS